MAFNYLKSRATAQKLIKNFGAEATLLKPGAKTGHEARPTIGPSSRHPVIVARISKEITSQTDPRLTVTKNRYLVSTETGVVPRENDQIEFQNKIETISSVREIGPSGLIVLWIVGVMDSNS